MIDNLATLTTVSVTIREIKNFRPPQTPTFGSRIQQTFGDSTDALIAFGQVVTICAVGVAPWLPLLAIVGACIYAVVRYNKRQTVAPTVLSVQPEAGPPAVWRCSNREASGAASARRFSIPERTLNHEAEDGTLEKTAVTTGVSNRRADAAPLALSQ